MDDPTRSPIAAGILAGDGEMETLMRARDWSATPIGPIENWPQSLRTAVSICLASRFPMLIWWGPELVMLYNDAYQPILGTKHPTALGMRGRECWPEIWDVIGPMLHGVLARGEATYSEDQLLLLDRNGYVEECYFTFSYSPIRDETGGVGGVFTAVTETTGRVLGERRLATLHELAARATEARNIEDACTSAAATLSGNQADVPFAFLFLLDADGRTARLAGVSGLRGDVPAALFQVDLTAEDTSLGRVARTNTFEIMDRVASHFGQLSLASEMPRSALVLPVAKAGQERAAGLLVAGINPRRALDTDYQRFFTLIAGQIATALADARAYEEERKRAEALAELDRAKTAFFSNVSHEFRTPLTLALGPVEDVLNGAGALLPAPDRERLEIAHRNHLRLLKLVNTLLDFARIEAGRAQASYEPTDLALLTADLASVFRSAMERAGLRLTVDCPPLPEPVYVDHDMWEKIVLNLLSNALKYTFEGEIAVELRAVGDQVTLEVRDTGTGIPTEELPHIFERFHRVRGARARTHEGTGIGLALVREMVRLHGGSILVSSTMGEGSVFTVTLPTGMAHLPAHQLSPPRAATARARNVALYVEEAWRWLPERDGDGEEPPSPGPLVEAKSFPTRDPMARILLADDNADMRAYVCRLLGARYTVEAVADGAEALASALARPPDLVLTDIMMPGLDGLGLLRELRANPRTAALPVILLSARAGEEARLEGLEAGADDYLVKPFSARELAATVGAHVALARARVLVARLHQLTVALSASVTSDQVADAVITHGVGALAATAGVVWLLSADGASLVTARSVGYPHGATAIGLSIPVTASVPIADAVRERAPVILESRAERDASYPQLAGLWAGSDEGALVAIPLLLGDRVVGGLGLGFSTARRFDAEEQAAMRALGELCAQALDRVQIHEAERKARAEAEAGRQRLSEIFQQAPAMIAVLSGPEHVFTVANLLYQQGVERDSAALLGRSVREVFAELEDQGIIEVLDSVYRTGTPYINHEMLVRLRRGDGRLEDIYFTFTCQPLRDAAGKVEGIFVHAVDVTPQVLALRRTEELARLARAERDRLRQVLDALPAGVLIADLSGRFTMSNVAAAAMFGSDLDGHQIARGEREAFETFGARRLDGTPYPSDELPLQRALWRGETVQGERFLIRGATSGRDIPVLANTAPLRGPDGAIVGAVGIFQDITSIRDLERAREEFLSSAAHDLKNPLTSIRGQAQLAQRRLARLDIPETGPVHGQLTRIQEGADTMLGLINELVDVARQQTGGGIDLQRAPADLVALVEDCVEAQREASGRSIHLEAAVPELHAVVDAARITRVVGNLLSNALKYSPADSDIRLRIAIETGAAGSAAVLVVRDKGMGIPAADLPHIFDRFTRAHNVVGHVQGTGIGLASARGIVEQHGGTITVESTEGAGATFTVRLPLEAS